MKFITRKEIASLAEASYDTIRKSETIWGIKEFRRDLNGRVRFLRSKTLDVLKVKGIV